MSNKTKLFLKILLSMLVAFTVVTFTSGKIFLADSPMINPNFISSLKTLPSNLLNSPQRFFANKNQTQQLNQYQSLQTNVMKSLAPGVYAKEDDQGNPVYVRVTNDLQWEERTLNENGKTVVVRYPKGFIK